MKNRQSYLRSLLAVAFVVIAGSANAQSVSIGSVSRSNLCNGDSIRVTFTATGTWRKDNVFILQLSNEAGSFVNGFQNISTLADSLPGTFTMSSQVGGKQSTAYRFRILATDPYIASADNGSDVAFWPPPGSFYFTNSVTAGAVGVPTTFTVEYGDLNSSIGMDSAYWDFGPDATPASASSTQIRPAAGESFSQNVTYSTTGTKTINVTIVNQGGCSQQLQYKIRLYDCSRPVIPHNAIVVDSNSSGTPASSMNYWVNPGVVFGVGNADTVFAEPGSTIDGYGASNYVVYMKPGSELGTSTGGNIFYADGASILPNSHRYWTDYTQNCVTLDFDYSHAPPNPAHPSGVKNEETIGPISLSPNPTRGVLRIEGLPTNTTTVSVFNLLGETVLMQKGVGSHELTLDLSKLTPGTYYIRIASANSVVTKMVVRE